MLSDQSRMAAYHSAIVGNSDLFKDKIVMDVGTGSGILACWAANAGARKVYAIEYTDMAENAKLVMKANGVDHVVEVIQGAVEDVVSVTRRRLFWPSCLLAFPPSSWLRLGRHRLLIYILSHRLPSRTGTSRRYCWKC